MHSVIGLTSIALLGSVAIAQTTTSLFLPGLDGQPLVASIKGSHDSTTTYFVDCPSGTDSSDCGVGLGFDYVQGPSTMQLVITDPYQSLVSVSLGCSLAKSSADCTETIAGSEADFSGLSSTVVTGTDFSSAFIPVTITAGKDAVSASTGAAATAPTVLATTTAASTGSQTASNAAASTPASSSSTAASSSSTAASSSSTGGVPQITGNAHWAIGGVAAAVALAAL